MPRKPDIKAIDKIVKEVKLSKEQRRLLHEEISGQPLSLDEVRQAAKEIKRLYPKK